MKRTLTLGAVVLAGWLGLAATSHAQVVIRAPFVRVAVGDGVSVRAPFVRINTGEFSYGPYYGPQYSPPPVIMPPPQPMPPANNFPPAPQPLPPLPKGRDFEAPPMPFQPAEAMSLEQFGKTFQPKAGSYEVTIMNPVTKQPTNVRFTLPEGQPKRVNVNGRSIEFVYGFRQFVRIEFDRDGALVTSR